MFKRQILFTNEGYREILITDKEIIFSVKVGHRFFTKSFTKLGYLIFSLKRDLDHLSKLLIELKRDLPMMTNDTLGQGVSSDNSSFKGDEMEVVWK